MVIKQNDQIAAHNYLQSLWASRHDLGEMSCDRASLARLFPKSVVLDLGVPTPCKMQDRFSLRLENGPHHMSTAPCAWSWAAFPPDWKMFSPYFVFGLQEKSTVGCQNHFFRCFCFTCVQRRYLQSDTLPIPEDHYINLLYNYLDLQRTKHCQRHNGPEGWFHITRSQFTVHKSWT